jgi:hypothetical protein
MGSPRRTDIERVVRAIVADADRRVMREVVVARGIERIEHLLDGGSELPLERIRRENVAALAEMAACSNRRDAAKQVARRWSSDPHTQEILAQRFRRLRRNQK